MFTALFARYATKLTEDDMRIAVVGAGKVGFTLASHLLAEGHDITVIDSSERVLTQIANTLDIIAYSGNGAAYSTLVAANIAQNDLLIAATASDEINMLCCLTAHNLGVAHTIARVRNPEYFENSAYLREGLGLSMVINPERAAAQEIARILRFPAATRVEMFASGRAEMVSCRVREDSPLSGIPLRDLPKKAGVKVLICAAERKGDVLIPSGDFVPQVDDVLYVIGAPADMVSTFKKINLSTMRARSAMIVGGSRIGFYLASVLERDGVDVKIIERNPERAEEIGRLLPRSVVIVGDLSNHELLLEEGLDKVDAFVALTGLDEGNILAAIYASRQNVRKVIAKVNNDDLVPLMRDTALETTISPKMITVNQISRYVRALIAGGQGGDVLALYKLIGSRVEVLEFRAASSGDYLNIPFKTLQIKKHVLVACIVRDGKVIIPGGRDEIRPHDGVLVVTADQQLRSLSDILE